MNPERPDVSVVIPCFRGEKFIREAIASVLAQEGGRVEVIVVDDASPDRSADVVASLADERVALIRHPHNRGIAAARNSGLAAARGALVAFLDQDDAWLPGRLAAQRRVFDADAAGDVALVFCGTWVRDESGRRWRHRTRIPRAVHRLETQVLLARLLADNFVVLGSALIRRRHLDAAGPFDESIRGGSDDFDLVVRLAERGRFAHVPHALFVRRLHGQNYTLAERMIEESVVVIGRVERRHPGLARAARIGRGRKLYRLARDQQAVGARARAQNDYRRALAAWPWQPRAWIGLALCRSRFGDALSRAWQRARARFTS